MAAKKQTSSKAKAAPKKAAKKKAAPKGAAKKAAPAPKKKAPAPKKKKAPAPKKATSGAKKKAPAAKKKKVAPKKAPAVAPAPKPPAPVKAEAPPDSGAETVQDAPVAAASQRKAVPPKMPPRRADGTITVAFSPDADDAFMFYGLLCDKVDTEDRRYDLVREDIQVLNEKAEQGEFDVTAISFGAYPYIHERYALLSCGASFGDGRGPILIARSPIRTNEVNGLSVAIPGRYTTAALALRVWLPHARMELKEYPFEDVIPAVRQGHVRAGVIIHERQLTWKEEGFVRIIDFGQWWTEKTEGLPLPLGANAIRRDIPEEERAKIALDIKRSIAYGLGHREEALDYCMPYAKGLPRKIVDRYVGMYVNELALDYAERGRQAVRQFLDEARRLELIPEMPDPEFA